MVFITTFFICFLIGLIYQFFKRKTVVPTMTTSMAQPFQTQWVDLGPTVDILGCTFVKDDIDYVYKGLYYAQSTNGSHIFGVSPGIALTKQEFFNKLESME